MAVWVQIKVRGRGLGLRGLQAVHLLRRRHKSAAAVCGSWRYTSAIMLLPAFAIRIVVYKSLVEQWK